MQSVFQTMQSNQSIFGTLVAEKAGIELDLSFKYTSLRFPVIGLIFYLLSIHLTAPKSNKPSRSQTKCERKFGKTETVMFVHNVILAVFSALTFICTSPIIYELISEHGVKEAMCSKITEAFSTTSYGFWVHLFYLSKFYEFVDTWIVIARGRRPITLQVFHHCGAVLGLWALMVTRTSASFWFVVLNSFIHTVMYSYYACSVIGIKFRLKFIITMMQMTQFVVGLGGTAWQYYVCRDCVRFEEKLAIYYHFVYVPILFVMFAQFYVKTYSKKQQKIKKT